MLGQGNQNLDAIFSQIKERLIGAERSRGRQCQEQQIAGDSSFRAERVAAKGSAK